MESEVKRIITKYRKKIDELNTRNKWIRTGIPNMHVTLDTISTLQRMQKEYDKNQVKIDSYQDILTDLEIDLELT